MNETVVEFTPEIFGVTLARDIMVVSRTRVEGAWCAYIKSVAGTDHSKEWQQVAEQGVKLEERVARAIFPRYRDMEYAG